MVTEWTAIPMPPRCSLCNRAARWRHSDGDYRCHLCPRIGQDGVDESAAATRVGLCAACKLEVTLTPTGLIMKHSARGRYDRCPGSKHRPRGDQA